MIVNRIKEVKREKSKKYNLKINNNVLRTIVFSTMLLTLIASVFAAQPTIISLQGKMTNATTGGTILNAEISVNVSDSTGQTIWNETYANGISGGFFDLLLGSSEGNELNLTFNENYNISLRVGDTQIGGTYRFQGGQGQISPSNLSSGNFTAAGNFSFGSTLYIDKTNERLGIGTSAPTSVLHTIGETKLVGSLGIKDSTTTGNAIDPGLHVELSNSNAVLAKIEQNGGAGDASLLFEVQGARDWIVGIDNSLSGDPFVIAPTSDLSTTPSLLIDSSGKVGINTTNPKQTLTVQGTLNVTSDGTAGPNLFVDSDGQVGIGTSSPSEVLEVTGGTGLPGNIQLGHNQENDNQGASIIFKHGSRTYGRIDSNVTDSSGKGGDLIFSTMDGNSLDERLRIERSGNVGIGTTTPTKTLSVNGTLDAMTIDPSAAQPTLNTTGNNISIASASGSVIIQLG